MQPMSRPSRRIARSMVRPRPSTQKRRLFSRSALGITGMHAMTCTGPSFVTLPWVTQDTGRTDRAPLRAGRPGSLRSALAEPGRHPDQLGQGARLHFPHHLTPMRLHRDLADAELAADLLVQPARDDQRHDLLLATAEGREAGLERPRVLS